MPRQRADRLIGQLQRQLRLVTLLAEAGRLRRGWRTALARVLGVDPATITRDLQALGGRRTTKPANAQIIPFPAPAALRGA